MMIDIGNLDIDKLYVGNDKVEKIYLGNDLVWEASVAPVTDTVLNLNASNQTSATLNIYKINTTATQIYLDDTLVTTSTTLGTQDISVTIPSGTSTLKISGGTFYFDGYCLGGAANNALLTEINFGNNYGNIIGGNAFRGCTVLTGTLTIPNSVTSIGSYAFAYCRGLTGTLSIPSSVASIGNYAFLDCSGLAVYYGGDIEDWLGITFGLNWANNGWTLYIDNTAVTELVIPNIVTSISVRAFRYCTGLTEVTIPSSVTGIGNSAFYGCTGLTRINYGGDIEDWFGITFGPNWANNDWTLYINNSAVTNLTIPSTTTSIGQYAFISCSGLTSVVIPDSVTSIGGSAFYKCIGLTSVTIGSGVTSIGNVAFYNCTGLTEVTITASTPPTLAAVAAFTNTNDCPFYVPSASVSAYQTETNWSTYASRIQAIPE